MKLIGRNLSPFVRRTATALNVLGMDYEVLGLSTADDADEIRKYNPVGRVPALILDDGEALVDSGAIIDHLNEIAPADKKLIPASGAERRQVLRLTAIAHGVMEKAVASSYERGRRPEEKVFQGWVDMVEGQVVSGLAELEKAASGGGWLSGEALSVADINTVVAFDFVAIAERYLLKDDPFPNLKALSERANTLPAFADSRFKRD
jgi:glutathione S-transferase